MAKATTSTSPQSPSQKPPTAKAAKAPTTPPAKETRIINGIIERYEHGQLVSRDVPKPAATPKPAPTPTPAKAPTGPKPGEAYFVGKLNTEDLWEFAPISAEPGAAVIVRHYKGYDVLSESRRSAEYANRLYHEMLEKGLVYIDGVKHKLVDEDL